MAAWDNTIAFSNEGATISPLSGVVTTSIYCPAAAGQWAFSHGPDIAHFAGSFFVIFTNGRVGEGERGCRVTIRKSPDFLSWSDSLFIGPSMGIYGEASHLSGGFLENAGKLYAFYSAYEYDPKLIPPGFERPQTDVGHLYVKTFYVCTDDGITWSAPKEIGPNIVMNRPPTKISSGRVIMPGEARYDWTDNPNGTDGYVNSGLIPDLPIDGPDSLSLARDLQGWETSMLCEGSFIETDEYIAMFLRSGEQKLWVTLSQDDGEKWSRPGRTSFAHSQSKFHAGRLADGRYFLLGNPPPGRDTLSLWLSTNGKAFTRRFDISSEPYSIKYPGFAKSGAFGYPSLLEKNGQIFAVCSRGKEEIAGYRFTTPL